MYSPAGMSWDNWHNWHGKSKHDSHSVYHNHHIKTVTTVYIAHKSNENYCVSWQRILAFCSIPFLWRQHLKQNQICINQSAIHTCTDSTVNSTHCHWAGCIKSATVCHQDCCRSCTWYFMTFLERVCRGVATNWLCARVSLRDSERHMIQV